MRKVGVRELEGTEKIGWREEGKRKARGEEGGRTMVGVRELEGRKLGGGWKGGM